MGYSLYETFLFSVKGQDIYGSTRECISLTPAEWERAKDLLSVGLKEAAAIRPMHFAKGSGFKETQRQIPVVTIEQEEEEEDEDDDEEENEKTPPPTTPKVTAAAPPKPAKTGGVPPKKRTMYALDKKDD